MAVRAGGGRVGICRRPALVHGQKSKFDLTSGVFDMDTPAQFL
jgi:hypothetical protein